MYTHNTSILQRCLKITLKYRVTSTKMYFHRANKKDNFRLLIVHMGDNNLFKIAWQYPL